MLEKFATMKPIKYASNGFRKKFGKVMLALACGSSLVIAPSGAIAQTADSNPTPSNNLNIPPDVTLFGKSDPNVRKATAIINGEIITGTDVDQRLALIITANGGKVEEQEKERLRLQVLRNLIRSEEHTYELQSLMRISYAVFCLKKKTK